MRVLLKILLWLLPIINYLWSFFLDYILQYIEIESNDKTYEIPFIWCIIQVLYVLVVIYLYCYLFLIHRFYQYCGLITIIAAVFQLFIHVVIYVYNTVYIHDYDGSFPFFYFFYSIFYFIPFYIIAYILFKRIKNKRSKQS